MTPLRQRMIEDMQVRNFSPHTQSAYVLQVSLLARYFGKPPDQLGPEDIRSYQVYLTNEKKLAPSSILRAVGALRFLYQVTLHKDWSVADIIPAPKKPQKLPIVLSPEEVLHFLGCVASPKHRTILTTCYAAGLRVPEAVRLQPAEIDSQRMVIRVEIRAARCASWQADSTLTVVMCRPGIGPGKSHGLGWARRHQSRRISSSRGESMTVSSTSRTARSPSAGKIIATTTSPGS